jgi:hypothetical protein
MKFFIKIILVIVILNLNVFADVFVLKETKLTLKQADYEKYIFYDQLNYPHISGYDRKKLREERNVIEKKHKAVIMENEYLKVTVLPEMGRIYSIFFKVTGNEELYQNPVILPMGAANDLRWWLVVGGIEFTLPTSEHGVTWSIPYKYKITEDSKEKKSVKFWTKERRTGIIERIEVILYPDKSYLEYNIELENSSEEEQEFQFWICPMWTPGGKNELTEDTEFIISAKWIVPPSNYKWMLKYGVIQNYDKSPLRFIKNWTKSGYHYALELNGNFDSAYSHELKEGIVRVFNPEITPGVKTWAWGWPYDGHNCYSFEHNKGYVEIWGGLTRTFNNSIDYVVLKPDEKMKWTEFTYPYHNTGGLTYSDKDFSVNFCYDKNDNIELGIFSTQLIEDIEIKIVGQDKSYFSNKIAIAPDKPFYKEIKITDKCNIKNLFLKLTKEEKEILSLKIKEKYSGNIDESR